MIFCTKYYDTVNDKWYGNFYINAYSWEEAYSIAKKNGLELNGEWIAAILTYQDSNGEIVDRQIQNFSLGQDEFMLWERPKPQRPE